jgi:predicted GIY-YIG superfamily endonuclease
VTISAVGVSTLKTGHSTDFDKRHRDLILINWSILNVQRNRWAIIRENQIKAYSGSKKVKLIESFNSNREDRNDR